MCARRCSWRGHLRGAHIHYCPVFLEGTPARGTYSLLPCDLRGDTCEGYIFIFSRMFLEGTPVMGTYGFHYCPSVLGGDTYNRNDDFADIVDFLNASFIRYSLTVNPTVYVSYIEQFWSTAKTKTTNNETQIYAKVAGKSVVVTESSVRSDLHFNDEDGATCLTTVKIFENLALMGYERDSDKLSFEKFKINCLE
ncbi:hypothetical protein Tco_0587879 [Tanacetum coccineum]